MLKSIGLVASVVCLLALAVPQANAAVTCTQADWTKVNDAAGKMTDATKKATAMKELAMAKDMMDKKDMAACTTHMAAANSTLTTPF